MKWKNIIFILNIFWKIKYPNHSEKFQNGKNRNDIPEKSCKINFNLNFDFSYYRDKNKREIDLIITDENSKNHLYEIKMNNMVDSCIIKNFQLIKDNIINGEIICTAKVMENLDNKNQIIPLSAIID